MSIETKPSPTKKPTGLGRPGRSGDVLVVGGPPRVHLLPPEVLQRKRGRALRRRLGLGLIGVIILVAVAIALATVYMFSAQASLVSEQNRASDLLSRQAQFLPVTRAQQDVQSIKTSQTLATTTEIAWQPYIAELEKTLPKGMDITAVTASIDSQANAAAPIPLQGPRIATLKVTVTSPQKSISEWLTALQGLTGFVDETPGSVALDGSAYKVDVVLHVGEAALLNRFAVKK